MPNRDELSSVFGRMAGNADVKKISSAFWITAGVVFVIFALIGLLLPIVPTVPFLIVAAFCFGRGSKRMETWILEHRHFGPPVRDWRQNGAIATHYKVIAIFMMAASLIAGWVLGLPPLALGAQAVILLACSVFVATRPGRERVETSK